MTEHQDTTAGQRAPTASGRTTRRARILAAGTVLLAAGSLLTGCGDQHPGASSPQSVKGTAAPAPGDATGSTPPSGSTAPSTAPTTASESGAGAPAPSASRDSGSTTPASGSSGSTRCHTSDLKASVGPNHPGAGQENFALVVTNRSGRLCTVRGYPGMAFVNSEGQQVSVNPERTDGTKSTIGLAPGRSAWAPLSFSNPQLTGVTTVTPAGIRITPPDETAPLSARWSGGAVTNTGKASVPKVGPFSAGPGPGA